MKESPNTMKDPLRLFWKEVTIILLSLLVSLSGGYIILNQRAIAREEAEKIIKTETLSREDAIKLMDEQSPWVIERSGIKEELKGIHEVLNEIKTDLKSRK